MRSGLLTSRVVQVHPTLRCNLACAHCYSSSSPRHRRELSVAELTRKLSFLRGQGFEVVSFSGGEPLVYRGFDDVAAEAHRMGYRVNLISNGLLLGEQRLARLAGCLSTIGISLDGPSELHDELRGRRGAFERIERLTPLLRSCGTPFGFAHCLTSRTIQHLPWLLDFCLAAGAKLLQIHPLGLAGRAAGTCDDLALSGADMARAFLVTELLRIQAEDRLAVQLDLIHSEWASVLRESYSALVADEPGASLSETALLSDLVNPVVVDENGALWPIAYGMHAGQRIADSEIDAWPDAVGAYAERRAEPLRELIRRCLEHLAAGPARFLDWYSFVLQQSHSATENRAPCPDEAREVWSEVGPLA